ncbi:MAG TPA: PIN domain-containing protein [Thermoanaerobaculia bacterium]|nr:PIN domain-containing protein [Thermoanaerobaculia bacterium]
MVGQPRGATRGLIAIDTSALRRFLSGESGRDVDLVRTAVAEGRGVLPPVVLCEALSDPNLPAGLAEDLSALPILDIEQGFWFRAGMLRSRLIKAGYKAKLADVLIAQTCIDHGVALISNDRDFRHFTRHGLKLV